MAAQVTATSLNLRDAPNGERIGVLLRGAPLDIVARQDGWARVHVSGPPDQTGWVSAQYISDEPTPGAPATSPPAAAVAVLPPADDPDHPVKLVGQSVIGPDGRVAARAFRSGFYSKGETPLPAWLAATAAAPGEVSASAVRVVSAMCANEGDLEAVNSYDDCHISFGIFQWTAGQAGDAGELAALLARVQQADPAAYQECFGRYGLEPDVETSTATSGHLKLDGARLATGTLKDVLRSPAWAYRFWRAGHHPSVRACQVGLAASRIARFTALAVAGQTVGAWMTSEHAVALVLDEHVNRPGHVPGTLGSAITALGLAKDKKDPANWVREDEARLIEAYLAQRAQTNMTDSNARALRIGEAARAGRISDARNSFQA